MPTLLEKIQGCNAAAFISNSMGDVTEGKSHQQINELYGFVVLINTPGKSSGPVLDILVRNLR